MQFESFEREQPTINVSALIDVVFILLIFVVLAANFDQIREMNVVLPTADETQEATSEALVLTLPADGPMLIDGEPIKDDDLEAHLQMGAQEFEILVLVGDGSVNLADTVDIFDKAAAAGFESVSIATRQRD